MQFERPVDIGALPHEPAEPEIGLDQRGRVADRGLAVQIGFRDQVHRLEARRARLGTDVGRRQMPVMQQRTAAP